MKIEAGKEYVTANGQIMRCLCTDGRISQYPIVMESPRGDLRRYNLEGKIVDTFIKEWNILGESIGLDTIVTKEMEFKSSNREWHKCRSLCGSRVRECDSIKVIRYIGNPDTEFVLPSQVKDYEIHWESDAYIIHNGHKFPLNRCMCHAAFRGFVYPSGEVVDSPIAWLDEEGDTCSAESYGHPFTRAKFVRMEG